MSAHLRALGRAQGAILIAHMVKTAFALLVLGVFGMELAGVATRGDLVQLASFMFEQGPRHFAAAQWSVCGYALLGPLLTQFVLAALLGRGQPKTAALRRYARALGLSVLRIAALGATVAMAWAASNALALSAPPQLETTARLMPLLLGAGVLMWLATVHDLASAQLAATDRPRVASALAQAMALTSPRLISIHALFTLAVALAFVIGEGASRTLWPAPGLAASQTMALVAAFIRAGWLSCALTRINQSPISQQ